MWILYSGRAAKRGAREMNELFVIRDGSLLSENGIIFGLSGTYIPTCDNVDNEIKADTSRASETFPGERFFTSEAELLKEANVKEEECEIVDATGKCILPGFVGTFHIQIHNIYT
tara:strand:+ start:591 stop:935 length:345 start_codon:yes stop_codon:yes gene_type:complete